MASNSKEEKTSAHPSTLVQLDQRLANCIKATHLEVYHPVSAQMGKAEQSWDTKRHAEIYIDEERSIAHVVLLDPVDRTRPARCQFTVPFSNIAWYTLE